jgi:uncharacterized protein (TIGR00255 family)
MQSMTGYGSASAKRGAAVVVVEARALNNRFLDVRVRFPPVLTDHAAAADDVARKQLVRGRVELSARLEGTLGEVLLDRDRARQALSELDALRRELGVAEPVPLALLSLVPNLFTDTGAREAGATREAVLEATEGACAALVAMRRSEGCALLSDLRSRIARVRTVASALASQVPALSETYRQRLRGRLATLLEGTGVALDAGRLEHEVALLADRSDVAEELTRIDSHCEQFAALLGSEDEPLGRRLEFLLQELGREVNTVGSKVGELHVTRQVLDLKAELERMREQVQNVL